MGLMDKVKGQANQLAHKTQETAQGGKAKLDQAQANRRADAMLRQLGAAVYAQSTGRGTADSQAKIDKLVHDISVVERENGLNLIGQAQPTVPQPGSSPDRSGPPPGPAGNANPDNSASSLQPTGGTSADVGPSPWIHLGRERLAWVVCRPATE